MKMILQRFSFLLLLGALCLSAIACGVQPSSADTVPDPAVEEASVPESEEQASFGQEHSATSSQGSSTKNKVTSPTALSEESAQEPPASSQTAAQPANPFVLDPAGNYRLYAYNADVLGYTDLGHPAGLPDPAEMPPELAAAIEAINALPPLEEANTAPATPATHGLLRVELDGNYTKTQFFLYPDILSVNGTAYSISVQQHEALKKAMEAGTALGFAAPQWFVYMNPYRVTDIRCTGGNGKMRQMIAENLAAAAAELSHIVVTSCETYKPGSKSLGNVPFKAVYTFDNGVTYSVYISDASPGRSGATLYVESSDMRYACAYKVGGYISSYIETTQSIIDGPLEVAANPLTGKPVIYLYPERTQAVSVRLNFAGRLTYTYPAYRSGWNVTASPDGTLTDHADGSEHYYLFWEGTADKAEWDFSQGFVVPGTDVDNFLREKLTQLGLKPREYNDFITYWAPELARNRYNLVTFAMQEYDDIAKLDISPQPDTVLRVHMVYKAIPAPATIEEQILPPAPAREGFTVVEWGGTRA